MTIQGHRVSTALAEDTYLDPDGRQRSLLEDYEMGPVLLEDTSKGLMHQVWTLTYDAGTDWLTVTPDVGDPENVLQVADLTQCSFTFDQTGHVNISYTVGGIGYLWWWNTDTSVRSTTNFGSIITPTLALDDKRPTQNANSDIILYYTKLTGELTYTLYTREQRDRYETEYTMQAGLPPYIYKCGMHKGLRQQISLRRAYI
jgi:hypothetical protein